ncbi:MAG: PAS domain S-box protein [Okeania sp. SIO3B5]|uniref:PAS domain S-box protein n=1 Tax=Okeania sp. SIO3B5 TaxID=2607811 RepID=UPI0013FF2C03|nr:PAS domain S-box protein [Okeania sp. SIO3B5]NEO53164.1 PAS domain S-box protein [Okeania sp. SIO3B5]
MNNPHQYIANSQEICQNIITSMESVLWSVEPLTKNLLYLSDSAEIIYGKPVSDLLRNPHSWLEVIYPEDRQKVEDSIAIISSNKFLKLQYRIVRYSSSSEQEIRWLDVRAKLICNTCGEPVRIDGISTDITNDKISTFQEIVEDDSTKKSPILLFNHSLIENYNFQLSYLARDGKKHIFEHHFIELYNLYRKYRKKSWVSPTNYFNKMSTTSFEKICINQYGDRYLTQIERNIDRDLEEYKAVLNILKIGFFVTDNIGNLIEINRKAKQIFGWQRQETKSIKAAKLELKIIRYDGTEMPKKEYAWIVAFREKCTVENLQMGVVQESKEVIWLSVTSTFISSLNDIIITTYVDITECKITEEKLKKSELKYRAFMQDAGEAILIADLQGKIIEANSKATEILGYQREELVQMHAKQIHPPEIQQKVIATILETAKKGKNVIPNILALRKDGNWVWVNIIYKIIHLENDEKFYQVIFQDITSYVLAEAVLRESEEKFRATFEQTVVGIFFANLSGKIFRVNQAFRNILGYSNADLSKLNLIDIIYAEEQQDCEINLRSLMTEKIKNYANDNRLIHKKGKIIWSYLNISLIKTSQEPKYLIGLIKDITQRKQMELDLKKSEERWELALRGNNDGIWDWNIKTNECFYSIRCQEILGYTETGIFNHINHWKSRIHPDDINLVIQSIQEHLNRQTPYFTAEYRIRCKDNTYKWILDRGQALWDEKENPLRMVGSYTDITERKQVEDYLQRQTQQEQLIRKITERIRQSLNLSEILQKAVDEVRNILQVERVIIQRKMLDKSILVLAESLTPGKYSMLDWEFNDYIITTQQLIQEKKSDKILAIADIYQSKVKLCNTNLLDFFQIKACLIMPIFIQKSTTLEEGRRKKRCDPASAADASGQTPRRRQSQGNAGQERECAPREEEGRSKNWMGQTLANCQHRVDDGILNPKEKDQEKSLVVGVNPTNDDTFWGVLVAHNCSEKRQWKKWEINLLYQLRIQLEIAIQQSELYQQLQNANQELYQLATLDGLTKIANRRCFDRYLEREWLRIGREKKTLSLIMCDIDFFKKYNDTYGHQKGDECLQQVAKAISKVVKRPTDLVARYGGEEFAIILPNTNLEGAIHIANIVQQEVYKLQIPHRNSPTYQQVTLSLGVSSIIPFPEATYKSLIAGADRALYQAKQKGRNQVIPYIGDIIVN